MLKPGIKIFCSHLETQSIYQRIELSAGTIAADCDHQNYCAGAFVPRPPWRSPSPQEFADLWTPTPLSPDLCVAVVPVPTDLMAPFMAAEVALAPTPKAAKLRLQEEPCHTAIGQLMDYFAPLCKTHTPPVLGGFGARPPNLCTTTIDRNRECRNGLHTDSWDKLSLSQKHQATNRICVNLGCDDRYFLFINLPEIELMRWLELPPNETLDQLWKREFTSAFMERYADYPVVKLSIAPGEAYIAPTENMIHDATSLNKQFLDVKVMFRGHYQIPQ